MKHHTKIMAKNLYLEGLQLAEIADKLNLNIHTLKSWVDKGSVNEVPWKSLKGLPKEEKLVEILRDKDASLRDIYDLGLNAVRRGLAHIELHKLNLDIPMMQKLVSLMDTVEKWQDKAKLEAESDATNNRKLSLDEVKKKVDEHPFFNEDSA